MFRQQLEKVGYRDDLQRSVPRNCLDTVLLLELALNTASIPLPLPLPCGDAERPPAIYMQWRNTALYIYDGESVKTKTAYAVFINADCTSTEITGEPDVLVGEICKLAQTSIGYAD